MAANPNSDERVDAGPTHRTLAVRVRQAPRRADPELERRNGGSHLQNRRRGAEPCRGAALRGQAGPLRGGRPRDVRRQAADRLRKRRRHDDGRGLERRHRPPRRRAATARAVGLDRQRRRGADHSPHQRAADASGEGQRVRHSHRAVREPHDGAVPHRRRAARGAAIETRRRVARRVARQGHVEARHRREAPAAGRPHLVAHRRACRRRARLDDPLGARRARRAAFARQASGPAHTNESRHGRPRPKRHGRAHPSAARHPARNGPDGLGQDDDACTRRSSASTTSRAIS